LLVPELDIINRYYASIDLSNDSSHARQTFLDIPNGIFEYKMIPVGFHLENVAVIRQEILNRPAVSTKGAPAYERPKVSDFKIHLYPFDKIVMRAHLHPRYAIFEAGRKLMEKVSKRDVSIFAEAYPELYHKIRSIYSSWNRPIPENAEEDPQFRPPTPTPSEPISISGSQTPPRRLTRRQLKQPSLRVLKVGITYSSAGHSSYSAPSVEEARTMDWAFEDVPGPTPHYLNEEDIEDDEGFASDGSGSSQHTPQGRAPPITFTPPRRRRNIKVKTSAGKPNMGAQLTRNSLRQLDESVGSYEQWTEEAIEQWYRDIDPLPSLKRGRSNPVYRKHRRGLV